MANKLTIKRDLLKAFILGVLQNFDTNYTLEDRLRMDLLKQGSRSKRIAIMGENYTYGEVLAAGIEYPQGGRSAKATSQSRDHVFEVHLWRKLEDDDVYANSSQAVWDNIVGDDGGVLEALATEPYFQDSGNTYVIGRPTGVQMSTDLLDNNPLELAHYLTFRITVKG